MGWNLLRHEGWTAGPVVKYVFKRKESGGNPFKIAGDNSQALSGLGDVAATFEGGGFVAYQYKKLKVKVEVFQGINGHQGFVSHAKLDYVSIFKKLGPPIIYSLGPTVTITDARYNRRYFGINSDQSLSSGLSVYEPGAGFLSYGIKFFGLMPLTQKASMAFIASYDRLTSTISHSPLITEKGSPHQFVTGLILGYKFGW